MLVVLLTIGAMVLALCARLRRRKNKHSSTVEADPHTDELDSKEDKM